mgnify:CR=1 FL=1
MKQRFKSFKLKFWFRFFAVIDVLFSKRFNLKTYRKDGTVSTSTTFDSKEISDARRKKKL